MNRLFALALAGLLTSPVALAQSPDSVRVDHVQTGHDGMAGGVSALDPAALSPENTVVENAAGQPELSTLVTAVQAAGLAETLSGEGPFTVFAPTNAAFAAVPDLEALVADVALLTPVLTFHVVPGRVMAADLADGATLTTVNGEMLTVTATAAGVTVNGAAVVAPDIESSNGVVHVIDAVLVPAPVERMAPAEESSDE